MTNQINLIKKFFQKNNIVVKDDQIQNEIETLNNILNGEKSDNINKDTFFYKLLQYSNFDKKYKDIRKQFYNNQVFQNDGPTEFTEIIKALNELELSKPESQQNLYTESKDAQGNTILKFTNPVLVQGNFDNILKEKFPSSNRFKASIKLNSKSQPTDPYKNKVINNLIFFLNRNDFNIECIIEGPNDNQNSQLKEFHKKITECLSKANNEEKIKSLQNLIAPENKINQSQSLKVNSDTNNKSNTSLFANSPNNKRRLSAWLKPIL